MILLLWKACTRLLAEIEKSPRARFPIRLLDLEISSPISLALPAARLCCQEGSHTLWFLLARDLLSPIIGRQISIGKTNRSASQRHILPIRRLFLNNLPFLLEAFSR